MPLEVGSEMRGGFGRRARDANQGLTLFAPWRFVAEFDFTELIKAVPLENFHFSQRRAVFEIGWKEFGQDLELRVHIEPEESED